MQSFNISKTGSAFCINLYTISCGANRSEFPVVLRVQVRCMMAVLFLIGQKLEAPEIINQLLDVQSNPRKPQYRWINSCWRHCALRELFVPFSDHWEASKSEGFKSYASVNKEISCANWINNHNNNTVTLQLHQYESFFNISLLVSSMAEDFPLVLYDCHFEGLSWTQETEEVNNVLSVLQRHWTQSAVKTCVLHGMIQGLEAIGEMFSWTDLDKPLHFQL